MKTDDEHSKDFTNWQSRRMIESRHPFDGVTVPRWQVWVWGILGGGGCLLTVAVLAARFAGRLIAWLGGG